MEVIRLVEEIKKDIKDKEFKYDDPVKYKGATVYMLLRALESDESIYVGETKNLPTRIWNHKESKNFSIRDKGVYLEWEYFTKDRAWDFETRMINFLCSSEAIQLRNIRLDQKINPKTACSKELLSYFDETIDYLFNKYIKGKYKYKIEPNTEAHRISPRKILTGQQSEVVKKIINDVKDDNNRTVLVSGDAGTGKSIVAGRLFMELLENQGKKIALTSPITNLNKAFKDIFKDQRKAKNVSVENVGVLINRYRGKEYFDTLIIDEAHSLKRKGTGKASFLSTKHIVENELKDLMTIAKKVIIIYDDKQRTMPSNITKKQFDEAVQSKENIQYILNEQLRSHDSIVKFADDFSVGAFKDYDCVVVHKSLDDMISSLRNSSAKSKALVSTMGRNNKTPFPSSCNIEWQGKHPQWIDSEEAQNIKNVGYFNSIQGFDVDELGLIIDKNIIYRNGKLNVSYDIKDSLNHFQFIKGEECQYLTDQLNQLNMMMKRAISKLHIFIVDDKLSGKVQTSKIIKK